MWCTAGFDPAERIVNEEGTAVLSVWREKKRTTQGYAYRYAVTGRDPQPSIHLPRELGSFEKIGDARRFARKFRGVL